SRMIDDAAELAELERQAAIAKARGGFMMFVPDRMPAARRDVLPVHPNSRWFEVVERVCGDERAAMALACQAEAEVAIGEGRGQRFITGTELRTFVNMGRPADQALLARVDQLLREQHPLRLKQMFEANSLQEALEQIPSYSVQ
ncbi:MAG: hypothetical protein EBR79_04095, partial [Proteobacteria bacterium]|nr:hypothetical protein [Pseudomonadota bacterium]